MPTIFRSGPYRFFFYSADGNEPPHIHVERDQNKAKYWLQPVSFQSSAGFGRSELMDIYKLILEHQGLLLGGWNDYFGN